MTYQCFGKIKQHKISESYRNKESFIFLVLLNKLRGMIYSCLQKSLTLNMFVVIRHKISGAFRIKYK